MLYEMLYEMLYKMLYEKNIYELYNSYHDNKIKIKNLRLYKENDNKVL